MSDFTRRPGDLKYGDEWDGHPIVDSKRKPAPGKRVLTMSIMRHVGSDPTVRKDAPEKVERAQSTGAGQPLPEALQKDLEMALGTGLSDRRVHTGEAAGQATASVGASAYAKGRDIYFGPGRYEPDSAAGRRLIAHEVAHTVQTEGASSGPAHVSEPGDAHERSADSFADAFVSDPASAREHRPTPGTAAGGGIHRQKDPEAKAEGDGEEESPEDQLRKIQAKQMSGLLPAIEALPADVKTNYEAAHVGGPRLQAAMRAVNERSDWKTYITQYHGLAGHLPTDQLDTLMKYLGGPTPGFHFFKGVDNFDGAVESSGSGGSITLHFRAKFVSAMSTEGTPLLPKHEVDAYAQRCKAKIEAAWSGKASLTCAAPSVGTFSTKVVFTIVGAGQHSTITVNPNSIQSWMTKMKPEQMKAAGIESGSTEGEWTSDADKEKKVHGTVFDEHGHKVTTNKQSAAVHEFGHAIGVPHPDDIEEFQKKLADKKTPPAERKRIQKLVNAYWKQVSNLSKRQGGPGGTRPEAEYGDTEEEHANVMGKGNKVAAISGADAFNPFVPFQKIAEKWGDKVLKAKNLNKWSTG